ncbi:hypothetical protein Bbelb_377280 [Branchiostoma belcheri]|nr:hypothetical protein Bbelb_377280 [Branchiostoma belcheri]
MKVTISLAKADRDPRHPRKRKWWNLERRIRKLKRDIAAVTRSSTSQVPTQPLKYIFEGQALGDLRFRQHTSPARRQPTDVTERKDNILTTTNRRDTNPMAAQITWMQQELLNVTHDLEQFQLELDHLENQQQGATGISPNN